jgi:transcriptional regulator with XRE-family HTH domain
MQTAASTRAPSSLGKLLREWRAARGVSQLELALHAGFSARHLSFIETGRAQPSRQALHVLAEALDVPLRERNQLFEACGYAHTYRHTPLADEEMAHIRGVLEFILERHKPYAAVVLDRYANCLMSNKAFEQLVAAVVDASLLGGPLNVLKVTFHPLGACRHIVNWDQVGRNLLARTERELAHAAGDDAAAALLAELRGYLATASAAGAGAAAVDAADLLLPIHVRTADVEMRLFCTYMTLGTPRDVTLQELRVETFFPADAESERVWRAVTAI